MRPTKRPPATARPPQPSTPVSTPPPVRSAKVIKTEPISIPYNPSVKFSQESPSNILSRMPNPYRFTKGVVAAFPVIPNLILKPFPADLVPRVSNSTPLAPQNVDLSEVNQSPETRIEFPDDNRSTSENTEALENFMKKVYEGVF